jgi:flagellar hook-associated protein FlgK
MSSIPAIAVSGMSAAQLSLQTSAHNIANLGTANFRRQRVVQARDPSGGVSTSVVSAQQPGNAIEVDLVSQLQAKNAFLANLAVFRAHDRMSGSLLKAVS